MDSKYYYTKKTVELFTCCQIVSFYSGSRFDYSKPLYDLIQGFWPEACLHPVPFIRWLNRVALWQIVSLLLLLLMILYLIQWTVPVSGNTHIFYSLQLCAHSHHFWAGIRELHRLTVRLAGGYVLLKFSWIKVKEFSSNIYKNEY